MTDDAPSLPNWPPRDGKISIDEARETIAWIRAHTGLALEDRLVTQRSMNIRTRQLGTSDSSSTPFRYRGR